MYGFWNIQATRYKMDYLFWYLWFENMEEIFLGLIQCYNVKVLITYNIFNPLMLIDGRLVGLVVSMSDYWSWGRGFDPRHFHKF